MYPETLYPKTREVLNNIKNLDILKEFYLAGGTALALQIGHRKSFDLDFFAYNFPKRDLILQNLKPYKPKIIHESDGTLDLLIDDVKVSFLLYKYPLVKNLIKFEGIYMASIIDIACMKLSAISSRGSKKDFIDIYVILQRNSLSYIFEMFEKKYKDVSFQKLAILKSMIYFQDAENDPEPDFVKYINWKEIKNFLEEKVKNYFDKIL